LVRLEKAPGTKKSGQSTENPAEKEGKKPCFLLNGKRVFSSHTFFGVRATLVAFYYARHLFKHYLLVVHDNFYVG
jgi:hypothetical protein